MKRLFSVMGLSLVLVMASACSQGRKSLSAGSNSDRVSEAVVLDYNDGFEVYGEFQLQLNLDKNFAYLDVLAMAEGWSPDYSYRVMAKRYTGEWFIIAEGLTASPGQTVNIGATQGHRIYEYTEWIIAFEYQEFDLLYDWNDASSYMVHETTYWPELERQLALQ